MELSATDDGAMKTATYAEALTRRIDEWGFRESPASKETVLRQYELIRAEVTTSMQVQQQILGFGIATIGLLAGAAFVGSKPDFRSALLVIFLPLVAYLVVTIWFSEVMRMLRAGGFLMTLEKKLDRQGDGSLDWEFRVARGRLKYPVWKPYFGVLDPDQLRLLSVTFLFLTLAVASIALGWDDASILQRTFAVFASTVAVIVLFLLFQLRLDQLEEVLEIDPEVRSLRLLRRFLPRPR
jgi:hypothetical protein